METAVETFDPETAGVRVRAMVRPVLLLLVETYDPDTAGARGFNRRLRRRLGRGGLEWAAMRERRPAAGCNRGSG